MQYRAKIWKISIFSLFMVILIPSVVFANVPTAPQAQTELADTSEILMYLRVESANSGAVEGSVTEAGHEGSSQVISYHHQVTSGMDGTNIHHPFRIVKPVDKASIIFMRIWAQNEDCTTVTLQFYRSNEIGHLINYYTIRLDDATISSIEQHATTDGGFTETISFEYDEITWFWPPDGIEISDTWFGSPI